MNCKNLYRAAVFLVAAGLSAQAAAQGAYAEFGFESLSVSGASRSDQILDQILTVSTPSFRIGGVSGRAGWDLTQYLGLEAQATFGTMDTDVPLTASAVDGDVTINVPVELNRIAGVFAKARYPISDRVALHGRLGGVYGKFTVAASSPQQDSGSDTSAAAGVGAVFELTDSWHIRLDYTRFRIEGENADSAALVFGFSF